MIIINQSSINATVRCTDSEYVTTYTSNQCGSLLCSLLSFKSSVPLRKTWGMTNDFWDPSKNERILHGHPPTILLHRAALIVLSSLRTWRYIKKRVSLLRIHTAALLGISEFPCVSLRLKSETKNALKMSTLYMLANSGISAVPECISLQYPWPPFTGHQP